MKDIGKSVIQGVINGINSMVGKLYSSIKKALSGLVDKAKKALGINSPSKVFADQVGRGIPEGVAVGVEQYTKVADKAVTGMTDDVLAAANAELAGSRMSAPHLNGMDLERSMQRRNVTAQAAAVASGGADMMAKLDKILVAIEKGQVLMLDGKTLVGSTAADYDKTLGQRRALAARGAL